MDEAVEFSELAPGSHTLRVIAVKPWGESFKNEEAYAQTTFHVFAKTNENTPDPNRPQLIYSAPQGTYGAQPVLLDFYLSNAPLHLLAASDPDIADWRVRCDINGQSFIFDQWQPIYLKGFKPGQNWVQLTLIDEQGTPIKNAFNSTVRIVDFDPEQRDTLAKMTRGELTVRDIGQIVVSDYEPPVEVVVPTELDSSDQPEIEEATEPEEPATEVEGLKELLEEDLSEEDPLEKAPSESEQEANRDIVPPVPIEADTALEAEFDGFPEALPEDISPALETEEAEEIDEPFGEAIAPIESLSEPEETRTIQRLEEAVSDEQVDAVTIEEDAGEKPGFFTRVKTFWKELEESQPIPVTEPDMETIENDEISEDIIEVPATSDQLLIDSPLLIPELQPSNLN